MRKFEVGKRYGENTVVFEIIKRTEKTITYAPIYHAGRYNESKREEKKGLFFFSEKIKKFN